ncbi:MAG: U32 family peptidase, partial [Clostridia bacterium]|nr:U32 family peptidase [Clostridia bacterium]
MLETDLRSRKSCELLAPAGNFEKLKTAFMYGADAAYLGGTSFGLRAAAGNFTDEEIKEAIDLANGEGKKIYVTLNILPRTSELDELARYAEKLVKMGVHGAIISDIGAFMTVRKAAPDLPIHVSTQANNLNAATVRFWLENGAERVNLARELTVREIKEIDRELKDIPHELEAFVHGAMCMSYSGRCMLSDYLAGRSSNRGDCAQPCRWKYFLSEEKRPGEYMPVEESKEGTFIFNSKDLCMIEHIPELIDAGITSLKIEGRMKSFYYTAVVTSAYRHAIDAAVNVEALDPIW